MSISRAPFIDRVRMENYDRGQVSDNVCMWLYC